MKKLFIAKLVFLVIFVPQLSASEVELYYMTSGPVPMSSLSDNIVGAISQSAVVLNNVPTSSWTYGCSNTAAGMMFGYYDRTGYSNMYTGQANGGVAPLTDLGNQTSLIVTKKSFDGRNSNGHVDDYWVSVNSSSADPWEGNWSEHIWGDCVADFMGSNQLKWDYVGGDEVRDYCKDGATALFAYNGPEKLYNYAPSSIYGTPQTALCRGLRLFAESRGYNVLENYTQKIDALYSGGFSFNDYMAEINAGSPVMIQLYGHSMVGVGYEALSQTMYMHDGWGDYLTSMQWGGSYAGMAQIAMTVLHMEPTPEPASVFFVIGGILFLRLKRRNHGIA